MYAVSAEAAAASESAVYTAVSSTLWRVPRPRNVVVIIARLQPRWIVLRWPSVCPSLSPRFPTPCTNHPVVCYDGSDVEKLVKRFEVEMEKALASDQAGGEQAAEKTAKSD